MHGRTKEVPFRRYLPLAALLGILLAVPAFAAPVVLACRGQFTECGKLLSGSMHCNEPEPQIAVVEYEEATVKQVDERGFLEYKDSCKTTESEIICSEPVNWLSPASALSGVRSMTIERTSGKLEAIYNVDYGPDNQLSKSRKGMRLTWQGYCVVRAQKRLF